MKSEASTRPPLRLIGWIAIVAALAAMFFASPTYGQEAPDASPEAPDELDTQDTSTRVFLEIEAPGGEPVNDGDTFLVHVMVSDVEGLSAFDFQLGYDGDRVRPIPLDADDSVIPTPFAGTPVGSSDDKVVNIRVEGEAGQFLADSPRSSFCSSPFTIRTLQERVLAGCAGVAPPPCLGGPSGVDGSGRLGTVVFESQGGEMTDIVLVQSLLVLDDVEPPCDPEGDLIPVRIAHEPGGPVTVLLSGGDGSSVLLIVVIAVVVVAVLGAGLGGFLLYQRRDASSAASE